MLPRRRGKYQSDDATPHCGFRPGANRVRLGRDVALKILSDATAGSAERQARFHNGRNSGSAAAGPDMSRIVPWPTTPMTPYAAEMANIGPMPGAS